MIQRARTVEQAVAARAAGADFGAGLTALQLGWGPAGPAGDVVDIAGLPGLDAIEARDGALHVGALVTLERLRADPALRAGWPALSSLLGFIGALGVRNLATIGGNIAWGAGDLVPPLMALGAPLLTSGGRVAIEARAPDAMILGVELPPAPAFLFVEKVGFRAAFSPSLVTVAAACGFDAAGRLVDVRIALGGGPNRAGRVAEAEAVVEALLPDTIEPAALATAIADSGRCVEDALASATHRADVAARVLAHALRATRAPTALRAARAPAELRAAPHADRAP